ncbi:hypothetical protein ACN3VN_05620 [Xylella fastidiosa]|uniref:hypothetical protein n=1 Tax=Xylella fastidiosa TaxID=2371 RepID=UPI000B19C006|nr:hypothetical protein [Xylella fastidiosa]
MTRDIFEFLWGGGGRGMKRFIQVVYLKYVLNRSFFHLPFVTLFINFLWSYFLLMLASLCLVLLVLVQPTSGFQDYFLHSVSHSLSSPVALLCFYTFAFSYCNCVLRVFHFFSWGLWGRRDSLAFNRS